jgi:regulator of protease activity HflC (stomatin/prohibitin superfamily)
MAGFDISRFVQSLRGARGPNGPGGGPPPLRGRPAQSPQPNGRGPRATWRQLTTVALGLLVIYAGYFWLVRRYVVESDEVLVLLRKNGSRTIPGDQVVIPAKAGFPGGAQAWAGAYGDANGILEEVYLTGTYFGFSPFDYERETHKIVEVEPGKVGVVIRKFGAPLPPGQVLAGPGQRGPLPGFRQPGKYPEFSNPYAYDVKFVDPVHIDPGYRGVVTLMAGRMPADPNRYLVQPGERGTQAATEPEGFRYVNPYEQRITPISVKSQRFEMAGEDAIKFPSSDSFDIKMEGFVEWSIIPDELPLKYVQYAEGGELIDFMETKVILPYSRSYSRLVGSRFLAREFISGDTKLRFQNEFAAMLTRKCKDEGIRIHQALVRDIVPPGEIKDPINEREVARQEIKALEERIKVAKSEAELATQEAMAAQNQAIGEGNKQVVTITTMAEQESGVAITKANQELAVAKLQLQAAERLAEAQLARGEAEAAVVLLQRQAEAEPLRRQVEAFGRDGNAYARFFFYQQVAPSIRSILTDTSGPFGDIFRQYTGPAPLNARAPMAARAPEPPPPPPTSQPREKAEAAGPAAPAAPAPPEETSSASPETRNPPEVKP